MPSPSTRSADGFRWWLLAGSGLVVAAALFSSSREKPPVLFAIGFGLVMGVGLRLIAASFETLADRRVPWLAGLIVACGLALSFVPSYQRAARQWNHALTRTPSDPIAAAVLKSAAESGDALQVPPYSVSQYLRQRLPRWPTPWPEVMFCAELVSCGLLGAVCVGWRSHPKKALDQPVRDVTSGQDG